MNKPFNRRLAAIVIFLLPLGTYAQDSLSTAFSKCSAIPDDADRLACFDAVASAETAAPEAPESQATLPAESASEAATAPETAAAPAVPVAATAPVHEPIRDEIGKERVKDAEKPEAKKYSATVTRCDENPQSGQTYFFFDNGQVWKQSRYRRLRFRDCDFPVTVAKDGFGYEMYIPDKDRTIRITRIR